MLCNRKKSSPCLFLLVALLGAILAGCGGDEPAPAPPPPPPPPPPAFVPKDVSIELGTSGETLTLQTTESGGFTRNGEAFASGTTVEAADNTYRLVLADGEWAAEYVAPRPWATALGRSGDALLITRREDGLYEVGEGDDVKVFSSGGTLTASNGNEYRLTLNTDTNAWQVEYLPPEPAAVLLGMSGETVLVERLEGGGYSVGDQRVVDGSTVESASGSRYRLSMQDGAWTATFVPPPPISVQLGTSGQTVTLQIGEDGNYYKGDQLYASGSTEQTTDGTIYTLTLQNGMWSASVMSEPVVVSLGASGVSVTLQRVRTADGVRFEKDGRPFETGSTESAGGNTYRLVLQNGEWSAEYVPRTVVVALGTTGETVILRQMTEDGSRFETQDGRAYVSGTTETTPDGTRFEVVLRNGVWDAVADRGETIRVRLGARGGTITLRGYSNGDLTFDGEPFTSGRAITSPENGSEYIVTVERRDDGTWDAAGRFRPQSERVRGADGQLLLFRQEDGSYIDQNGDRVRNGDTITYKGERYELLESATQGWIATPVGSAPTTGNQVVVTLPNSADTITLTRNEDDDFEHDGRVVQSGDERTVGGVRYRLTQGSDGRWSAAVVRDTTTVDTGGVAGPTQTDTVKTFTDILLDTDTEDTDGNTYGVQLSTRGEQPSDADNRGTKIVPQRTGTNHIEFPVYDLMRESLVTRERTYVEAAKAKLQEIVDTINVKRPGWARGVGDPHDEIAEAGSEGSTRGLWKQAEIAVGKIFGLTDDTEDGILGIKPWGRGELDLDEEVGEVIAVLDETIAALSDVAKFGREFEDEIIRINQNGTPDDDTDDFDHDAADFFNGLMSRIRFGSTTGTRFGAYVVKNANATGTPSDAARGGWTRGVFAYTPNAAPSDIPDRGEAKFSGSTVAVSAVPTTNPDVDDGNKKGAKLYAGKIELVASFTRKTVKGTITELKDESGRTWEAMSDEGRDKAVDAILLPDAVLPTEEDRVEPGFYESAGSGDDANATAVFEDSLTANKTEAGMFRVQIIDDAGEALGVWEAFNLEGAFGATRDGGVAKPTLPSEVDRGGGADAGTIHYITQGTAGDGDRGTSTADGSSPITAHEEQSTFTLTRGDLGLGVVAVVSDKEIEDNFENLRLPSLTKSGRDLTGSTFASDARTKIGALDSSSDRTSDVNAILTSHLGSVPGLAISEDSEVTSARSALLRSSNFYSAQNEHPDPGNTGETNVFQPADQDDRLTRNEVNKLISERRWDFKFRVARNRYTRFGVWAQIAPTVANSNLAMVEDPSASATDPPHTGSFAYSPLSPVEAADITSLNFVADYEGKTLAVHHTTGDLYEGQIRLVVNWGADPDPAVRSTITDLRGVSGSRPYFKHGTQDVRYIFFDGITATDGALGGTLEMSVRYRNSSRDEPVANVPTIDGVFVKDAVFTDEPVGVLGTWAIPSGNGIDAFSASFGAELKP